MQNENIWSDKHIIRATLSLIILASFFLVVRVVAEIKAYDFIGGAVASSNVISINGQGEVFAVPDIANITFSIREEGKSVADTQKKVSAKIDDALDFLKSSGVEDKDIKTVSYNAYPKYEYQSGGASPAIYPPQPGKQVLVGYEVSQSISVKVRDTNKVGAILEGIAKAGISEISGPDFSIDDDESLKSEARKKAIDDAKSKAQILADDLGVKLVRIVTFSEGGNYPIYYAKAEMSYGMGGATESRAPTPSLPGGENKIISNVTVTYEIR
ncbi:MAG: hypothetical protein A2648_01725 [Candidatus Lloydbacteria bacterium RIFCSPHIGHO2_01_FULL_41_20]|uniref:26 kDa periplasmic immunogenic protein n=1 Tax=Candidatus Lloydbacteria bacterium RIFCSPHIGHO2_01_FULL_41_20 TaxID=1798657 RepID=A0A1G2CUT0_9BACT|nr:MAG: hypothetical protein A2648_01725 [Candidatus Lloydbacteria bacterium RIFCSPHIGHO2_01_FULL_41_20]